VSFRSKVGNRQYLPERIKDPKIVEVMAKRLCTHLRAEAEKHKITVKLTNGVVYSHVVEYSKGKTHVYSPLSDQGNCRASIRLLPTDPFERKKVERSLDADLEKKEVADIRINCRYPHGNKRGS